MAADESYFPETLLETEDGDDEAVESAKLTTEQMLERLLLDNRQANEDLIRRVTQPKPGPLQQEQLAPDLEFSLDGLPDPSIDPVGFHRGYAARATAAVGKAMQQVRALANQDAQRIASDAEVKARADAMIKAANPALDDDLIGHAATVIAGRYRAEGRDPMTALRGNTEEVVQEILDYTDDLAARLVGSSGRQRSAGTANRTGGLVSPRSRAPAAPKPEPEGNNPQAFYKEFTEMQRKARIY